eukprot:g46200.t1
MTIEACSKAMASVVSLLIIIATARMYEKASIFLRSKQAEHLALELFSRVPWSWGRIFFPEKPDILVSGEEWGPGSLLPNEADVEQASMECIEDIPTGDSWRSVAGGLEPAGGAEPAPTLVVREGPVAKDNSPEQGLGSVVGARGDMESVSSKVLDSLVPATELLIPIEELWIFIKATLCFWNKIQLALDRWKDFGLVFWSTRLLATCLGWSGMTVTKHTRGSTKRWKSRIKELEMEMLGLETHLDPSSEDAHRILWENLLLLSHEEAGRLDAPATFEELTGALSRLSKGKCPGLDGQSSVFLSLDQEKAFDRVDHKYLPCSDTLTLNLLRWCASATYFFNQVRNFNYNMELLFIDSVIVRELLLRNLHLHNRRFEWLATGRAMAAGPTFPTIGHPLWRGAGRLENLLMDLLLGRLPQSASMDKNCHQQHPTFMGMTRNELVLNYNQLVFKRFSHDMRRFTFNQLLPIYIPQFMPNIVIVYLPNL